MQVFRWVVESPARWVKRPRRQKGEQGNDDGTARFRLSVSLDEITVRRVTAACQLRQKTIKLDTHTLISDRIY